jgi:hypothetical protein
MLEHVAVSAALIAIMSVGPLAIPLSDNWVWLSGVPLHFLIWSWGLKDRAEMLSAWQAQRAESVQNSVGSATDGRVDSLARRMGMGTDEREDRRSILVRGVAFFAMAALLPLSLFLYERAVSFQCEASLDLVPLAAAPAQAEATFLAECDRRYDSFNATMTWISHAPEADVGDVQSNVSGSECTGPTQCSVRKLVPVTQGTCVTVQVSFSAFSVGEVTGDWLRDTLCPG